MRADRLYYQNRVFAGGTLVDKDPAFTSWADGVMAKVRKALRREKALGAYVGAEAAALIAGGQVTMLN